MTSPETTAFVNEANKQLWLRLNAVVESRGEFGDSEKEFGIIRKAVFDFPKVKACMTVSERVDPAALDGLFAYHVQRSDWRSEYDVRVSASSHVGVQAVKVVTWDLERYTGATEESMEDRRCHDQGAVRMISAVLRSEKALATAASMLDILFMHGLGRAEKNILREKLTAEGYDKADVERILHSPLTYVPQEANDTLGPLLVPAE